MWLAKKLVPEEKQDENQGLPATGQYRADQQGERPAGITGPFSLGPFRFGTAGLIFVNFCQQVRIQSPNVIGKENCPDHRSD